MGRAMRLFLVGFPKSGTTTLQNSLLKSGLVSKHWWDTKKKQYIGDKIYQNYMAGRDPLAGYEGVDAITEPNVCRPQENVVYWPQLDFSCLLAIRKYHPSCIFLLNWRRPDQVARSMSGWYDFQHMLTTSDIPGLPRAYGCKQEHLIRWIENHFSALRTVFRDDPHFLEVDMAHSSAPVKIGQALGIELVTWEHKNLSTEIDREIAIREARKANRWRRRLRRAFFLRDDRPELAVAMRPGKRSEVTAGR